jgi:hypothetical protein
VVLERLLSGEETAKKIKTAFLGKCQEQQYNMDENP